MTRRIPEKGVLSAAIAFIVCAVLLSFSAFAETETTMEDAAAVYTEEFTQPSENSDDSAPESGEDLSEQETPETESTMPPAEETEAPSDDEDTLIPETGSEDNDQETTAPADSDQETTAPADSDQETTAPADSDQETAAPADSDQETAAPADSDQETAAPADSDQETAAPADSNQETAAPADPEPITAPLSNSAASAGNTAQALSARTAAAATAADTAEEPVKPVVLPLQNGTYIIAAKTNGFKALQSEGSSTAAGKQIEIKDCDGSNAQKFKFVGDSKTGYYTITNLLSGKILSVKGNTAKAGTSAVQSTASTALGQKWILVKKGDYYMFQSALDGTPLYLTLKGGSVANGTDAVVDTLKNNASQLFRLLVSKPNVNISNGVYEIANSQNANLVLDVTSGKMIDRSNIQLFTSNDGNSQKFIIQKVSGDVYTITGYKSGKAMEIKGGSTAAGTNVQLFTKNGGPGQKWRIRNVGDGTVYITSYKSNLPLEVCGGKAFAKANMIVYNPTGNTAQKFTLSKIAESKLKPIADGVYLIRSKSNTNRVIGIEDASRQQLANVQLQYNDAASFQKFRITYSGLGYYTIQNVRSKHVLEIAYGSYANKANIWQYEKTGAPSQLWLPHKNADGTFTFINSKTSKVLDLTGGSTADCTNVQAYNYADVNAQKFKLTKTTGSDSTAVDKSKASQSSVLSAMYKKAQDYSSDTDYLVLANITDHKLVLFKWIEGRWISVMDSPITVGKSSTPTPTGTFYVYNHWRYFDGDYNDSELTYQCWWSTCFYGSYYFHSVLYDYNSGYPGRLRDGRMEVNVSHGCVRMPLEKAEYLYDHSPIGTKVRVYR